MINSGTFSRSRNVFFFALVRPVKASRSSMLDSFGATQCGGDARDRYTRISRFLFMHESYGREDSTPAVWVTINI